jgi:anti-anti-sigma regulatory factor
MFGWTLRSPTARSFEPPSGSVIVAVAGVEALMVLRGRLGGSAAADLEPFRSWLMRNLCTDLSLDAEELVGIDIGFLAALIQISSAVRCNGGQLRVRTSSHEFTQICAAAALNANLESTEA